MTVLDIVHNQMNSSQNVYSQIITFQQRYSQQPSILLGFNHLDLSYNTPNISYEVIVSDISLTSANITVQRFDQNTIYGLYIFYIVIQDSEIQVQYFKLLLSDGQKQIKQFKLVPKAEAQNQVQCLLTGINIKFSNDYNKYFGIQVTNTQTDYTIEIQGEANLTYLTVNCLEYYKQITTNSYSKIADEQFLLSNDSYTTQLQAQINNQYTDTQLTNFVGITQLKTTLTSDNVL
ncbi:hypothetical protein ABPG72_019482 [Tetrahymena utriculariae]